MQASDDRNSLTSDCERSNGTVRTGPSDGGASSVCSACDMCDGQPRWDRHWSKRSEPSARPPAPPSTSGPSPAALGSIVWMRARVATLVRDPREHVSLRFETCSTVSEWRPKRSCWRISHLGHWERSDRPCAQGLATERYRLPVSSPPVERYRWMDDVLPEPEQEQRTPPTTQGNPLRARIAEAESSSGSR